MSESERELRIALTRAQMAATIYAGYLADSNVYPSKELQESCVQVASDMLDRAFSF